MSMKYCHDESAKADFFKLKNIQHLIWGLQKQHWQMISKNVKVNNLKRLSNDKEVFCHESARADFFQTKQYIKIYSVWFWGLQKQHWQKTNFYNSSGPEPNPPWAKDDHQTVPPPPVSNERARKGDKNFLLVTGCWDGCLGNRAGRAIIWQSALGPFIEKGRGEKSIWPYCYLKARDGKHRSMACLHG